MTEYELAVWGTDKELKEIINNIRAKHEYVLYKESTKGFIFKRTFYEVVIDGRDME